MDKINALEELYGYIRITKNRGKGYLTNFYLDVAKHSLWISKGELYSLVCNECIFLIRKNPLVNYLFYISTDVESLSKGLKEAVSQLQFPFMVDLVGDERIEPVKELFLNCNFKLYESLYRMSRTGLPVYSNEKDECVALACEKDAVEVYELLKKYFNPLSEQLPELEEVQKFIEHGHLLVYRKNNLILGFILFELLGATLYWRYWFVSPEFRDLKIGSKLFNALMYEGRNTKRQLFWVIAGNENAIKRHNHYGFKAEKLYDYVLIKK